MKIDVFGLNFTGHETYQEFFYILANFGYQGMWVLVDVELDAWDEDPDEIDKKSQQIESFMVEELQGSTLYLLTDQQFFSVIQQQLLIVNWSGIYFFADMTPFNKEQILARTVPCNLAALSSGGEEHWQIATSNLILQNAFLLHNQLTTQDGWQNDLYQPLWNCE